MGSKKKVLRDSLIVFGATTVGQMLKRPTIQSGLRGLARKLITGSREKRYKEIPAVERTTDKIADLLEGRLPTPACLGIDGIAGGGKSTLGRSLAKRFDLNWHTLYSKELGKAVEIIPGTIYENIRLFRTQDIDLFDAIFYIQIPPDQARERVLSRDRNGTLADLLDFETLQRLGDLAFDSADGDDIQIPNSPIRMKVRPASGFCQRENLKARLKAQGLESEGLGVEEMLFLSCFGEAKKGIRPYLKLGAYNNEILAGIRVAVLTALDELS
jgi:hypothetical protein